jgi:hypothetical protein
MDKPIGIAISTPVYEVELKSILLRCTYSVAPAKFIMGRLLYVISFFVRAVTVKPSLNDIERPMVNIICVT